MSWHREQRRLPACRAGRLSVGKEANDKDETYPSKAKDESYYQQESSQDILSGELPRLDREGTQKDVRRNRHDRGRLP